MNNSKDLLSLYNGPTPKNPGCIHCRNYRNAIEPTEYCSIRKCIKADPISGLIEEFYRCHKKNKDCLCEDFELLKRCRICNKEESNGDCLYYEQFDGEICDSCESKAVRAVWTEKEATEVLDAAPKQSWFKRLFKGQK